MDPTQPAMPGFFLKDKFGVVVSAVTADVRLLSDDYYGKMDVVMTNDDISMMRPPPSLRKRQMDDVAVNNDDGDINRRAQIAPNGHADAQPCHLCKLLTNTKCACGVVCCQTCMVQLVECCKCSSIRAGEVLGIPLICQSSIARKPLESAMALIQQAHPNTPSDWIGLCLMLPGYTYEELAALKASILQREYVKKKPYLLDRQVVVTLVRRTFYRFLMLPSLTDAV
jgi:hypothetical protein